MKRPLFVLLALAMSPCLAQPQPPEPGIQREQSADGIRIDLRLTGKLLSVATPLRSDGGRDVLLLTRTLPIPEEAPEAPVLPATLCEAPASPGSVELWQLRLTDRSTGGFLDLVRSGLPPDSTTIEAVDLDGDGTDELVLARPGQLMRLPSEADDSLISLIQDTAFSVSDRDESIFHFGSDGAAWVRATDVGRTRIYRSVRGAGNFVVAVEVETSTRVSVGAQGIQIHGSALTGAGLTDEGHPRFATHPRMLDEQRVRTDVIDPLANANAAARAAGPATATSEEVAAEAEEGRAECWARLPGRELPIERFVLVLDGDPVVLLTTMPAGKLNLFGEKLVRILPLRPDRSRMGHAPLLATSSRMNIWQMATPHILDLDADGRTDLVLGYWKGLKDDRVVLEAYPRNSAGAFSGTPKATAFNVANGDRSGLTYGEDLTGDGIADLILRGDGKLMLFPGQPGVTRIVRKKPSHAISLGWTCEDQPEVEVSVGVGSGQEGTFQSVQIHGGRAAPRLVDLDGDGNSEVLIANALDCGSGRLQLFFLDLGLRY